MQGKRPHGNDPTTESFAWNICDRAVLSLLLEEQHYNQPVLCQAENRATPAPLSSNTINIDIRRRFSSNQSSDLSLVDIWAPSLPTLMP